MVTDSGDVCLSQSATCLSCCPPRASKVKADKEIMTEIAAIIRQITASVTFLPILEEACESWQGGEGGRVGMCRVGWGG